MTVSATTTAHNCRRTAHLYANNYELYERAKRRSGDAGVTAVRQQTWDDHAS